MKDQKNKYEDFEDFLIEEEKKLDIIYKELLKNNENKNAINKFDRIVKSKIDYRGLLPCSKSYEGESLLTLSKTWMIIILIKITKGKSQQDQFLQLVNSSLTHELNEYDEYKEFYEEQCELIFSDDEALKQINLNPRMQTKLDNSVTHEELKNYYIYLLFRPKYFQKTDLDGMQKIKKENSDESENIKSEKNNKRLKEKKINNKSRKSNDSFTISISDESEEEYEKGDRLNENDMISKNRAKEPSYTYVTKKKNKSNSNRNNKQKNEKNDPDYNIIDDILNKTVKSGKKKEEKKKSEKKKKSSNYDDDLDDNSEKTGDIVIEIHNEDDKEDKKAKKNKNHNRKLLNDKKIRKNKKYEDELDEEWVEQEIEKKRNKNKNKKNKKQKDEENDKKDKKGKKEEKPKKVKNNRASTDKIFALLGINPDEVKEEEEDKTDTKTFKGRQSISLPKSNKKDKKEKEKEKEKEKVKEKPKNKDKNKRGEDNNKNKKKNKEKEKGSFNKKSSGKKKGGKQKKVKKSKSDDDDDNFYDEDDYDDDNFINSLSKLNQTSDIDSYGDDIDKMDEKDRKEIEKEINALVNGDLDEIDIDGLLEGSNIEGISLNSFNSKSSGDIDIDEEDN